MREQWNLLHFSACSFIQYQPQLRSLRSCGAQPYLNSCTSLQGKDLIETPQPDILSFYSPDNDAAITFINSTTVNGLVFQHGRAFDIVASADLLVVSLHAFTQFAVKTSALTPLHTFIVHLSCQLRPVLDDSYCGNSSFEAAHLAHHLQEQATHERRLSLTSIERWKSQSNSSRLIETLPPSSFLTAIFLRILFFVFKIIKNQHSHRWQNCYSGESKTHVLSIGLGRRDILVCQFLRAIFECQHYNPIVKNERSSCTSYVRANDAYQESRHACFRDDFPSEWPPLKPGQRLSLPELTWLAY